MILSTSGVCNPGGGALCATQAGALKALYEFYAVRKEKPKAVRGSSGGDLNSCLFVQAFADDGDSIFVMENLWKTISHHKVHTMIPHIYPRTTGLFKLTPLYKLLKKEVNPERLLDSGVDFKVVATRYGGGPVNEIGAADPDFLKVVLASASYPVMFKPQKIWGEYWADAGINNNLPLSGLIDAGCSDIFICRTERVEHRVIHKKDLRLFKIFGHIVSEMMETQITMQMDEIRRINRLVKNNASEKDHRVIELTEISPAHDPDNQLHVIEFNAKKCSLAFDNGYRSARKFLSRF